MENIELYKCKYCKKGLSTRQSRWRHEKTCKQQNNIEKRLIHIEKTIQFQKEEDIKQKHKDTILLLDNIILKMSIIVEIINKSYYVKSFSNIAGTIQYGGDIDIQNYELLSKNLSSLSIVKENIINMNKLKTLYIKDDEYKNILLKLRFINNSKNIKNFLRKENESEIVNTNNFDTNESEIVNFNDINESSQNISNQPKYEFVQPTLLLESDSDTDSSVDTDY
jgi:hypothetical protein